MVSKADIVGETILSALCTRWEIDSDGYGGRAIFLILSNDLTITLVSEEESINGIMRSRFSKRGMQKFEDSGVVGLCIIDVVASDLWPTAGLLLSDCSVITTGESEFKRVGPIRFLKDSSEYLESNFSSIREP